MRQSWIKIIRAYFVLVFALVLSACGAEDFKEPNNGPHEVGFYVGGGTDTRTEMLPNGLSAVWTDGDELAVWARNSAGDFTLSNQIFKTYGIDGRRGFFTSTLSEAMPDDTYTYYCTYPVPKSVDGTNVTFNIPAVQDGKVSGGADIMIATPVQRGALTPVPDPEDHSGMSMEMNRMLHQFRFYIPENNEIMNDEKITKIELTFPTKVVGPAVIDIADPSPKPHLSDGDNKVILSLKESLEISRESHDVYNYACAALAPVKFLDNQTLSIKAYTEDKIAVIDPISLNDPVELRKGNIVGKTLLPGHSTPIILKVKDLVPYKGIIYFTVAANNLGENPTQITFTTEAEGIIWGDEGTDKFVYNPGREIPVGERIAIKFETDLDGYTAFSNKQITVEYESENAILSETLTMPTITSPGVTNVSLTVPYLMFEDFSCVTKEGESYGNNSYSSEERVQPGSSLDACMTHKGWNAARYWTTGNSIRINTRYQCVNLSVSKYSIDFSSYHHGRLDTPRISGLKPNKTVSLKLVFDAGGYLHKSSTSTVTDTKLCIATHTNEGVLNGIPTGVEGAAWSWKEFTFKINNYTSSLTDFGVRQDSHDITSEFGENAFTSTFNTFESELSKMTSSTRIVFYVIYTGSSDISNAEFNVYIDNIKLQISK